MKPEDVLAQALAADDGDPACGPGDFAATVRNLLDALAEAGFKIVRSDELLDVDVIPPAALTVLGR